MNSSFEYLKNRVTKDLQDIKQDIEQDIEQYKDNETIMENIVKRMKDKDKCEAYRYEKGSTTNIYYFGNLLTPAIMKSFSNEEYNMLRKSPYFVFQTIKNSMKDNKEFYVDLKLDAKGEQNLVSVNVIRIS